MIPRRISESAVRRLSHYLRFLDEFESAGITTVSSDDLASKGGMTSAQVRKDLSRFGSFGKRGLGYPVEELRARMRQILGLDRRWRVALVGAGRLGAALFQYEGFRAQGFDFIAVFDNDPAKIGRHWGNLSIDDVSDLPRVARDRRIQMAIVVTPRENAQQVTDLLVEAGVEAILNFAPKKLSVPDGVTLRDVNLAIEIEGLSFALTHAGEIVTVG